MATLSSLGAGADDDDDDSEDEDDDDPRRPRDLFAGGEKSGLAVQDPNRRGGPDPRSIAQDLVNQAKSYVAPTLHRSVVALRSPLTRVS